MRMMRIRITDLYIVVGIKEAMRRKNVLLSIILRNEFKNRYSIALYLFIFIYSLCI